MHPSQDTDPLAVVRTWLGALAGRDLDTMLAHTHPGLEYRRWVGTERGHDAVRALLHRQSFGVVMRPTILRAFRRGGAVAVELHLDRSQAETDQPVPAQVAGAALVVRDGLVVFCAPHPELAGALRDAGLTFADEVRDAPAARAGRRLVVAVHGATGTQGGALVRRLRADGHEIRALVRSARRTAAVPGGSTLVAPLHDADALARAYAGADAVVVHLPLVADATALWQARAVAVALRRAEVPRAVFLTGGPMPPAPIGDPFFDARVALIRALEDGPVDHAIVEPAAPYMENLSAPWSAPLVTAGVIAYPLPAELPVPWVALGDVAAEAAAGVTGTGRTRVMPCGPGALTGAETAAALAGALGRPVRWVTVEPDEYGDMVRPHLGPGAARHVRDVYTAARERPPATPDPARLRPGATDLAAWARGQAWRGSAPAASGRAGAAPAAVAR